MTINAGLRLVAGTFVIISVLLAHFVNPMWFLFTVFIGLNLINLRLQVGVRWYGY